MISDPVAVLSSRARWRVLSDSSADRRLAGLTTAAMGAGTVLALAGVGSRAVPLAIAGGVLAWIAFVLVMGHRWLDPMLVVALSVPFPAVWAAGDLRIAAAAPITAAALVGWMIDGGPLARHFNSGSLPLRVLGLLTLVLTLAAVASPYNRAALGFGQPNGLGLFLALTMPLVAWCAGSAERGRPALAVAGRVGDDRPGPAGDVLPW